MGDDDRVLLSGDLFTVAEVERTPLAEDEPERLVDDCGGERAADERGVTTTHEMETGQLVELADRLVVSTTAIDG